MKKAQLQTIIVLVIMVVLPIISWLYMRSGVKYRLNTWAEFNRTDTLEFWSGLDSTLRKEYVLLYDIEAASDQQTIDQLKGNFKSEINRLAFIAIDDSLYNIGDKTIDFLRNTGESSNAYLINKQGVLYNSYNLERDMKDEKMFRHLAFIMPPEKRKELIFRRKSEM